MSIATGLRRAFHNVVHAKPYKITSSQFKHNTAAARYLAERYGQRQVLDNDIQMSAKLQPDGSYNLHARYFFDNHCPLGAMLMNGAVEKGLNLKEAIQALEIFENTAISATDKGQRPLKQARNHVKRAKLRLGAETARPTYPNGRKPGPNGRFV